jgi:hypothetical protein
MDDDASQAAGIAALGAPDAGLRRGARVRNGPRIKDSTPRPSPEAGGYANRGSSALAPPLGTKSTGAPAPGWLRTRGVTIDFPQVDCSTCPTTRAKHVEPRSPADAFGCRAPAPAGFDGYQPPASSTDGLSGFAPKHAGAAALHDPRVGAVESSRVMTIAKIRLLAR